ncbi:NrdH-like glutaredoxin [Mycobacterium Phage Niklas]|uniref:NrdH-like glutaredoxin n=1 Tax=Mycobacterium Phage Niklas TaxID=2517936 RepID=A0A482JHZ1_9CAUD|nr:NrdH-like glutaredoxin [Mycobacterium Phage Niklas]ASR85952.1 NrdH-like glutaredoxin [Mycobacterium phage Peanam]QAY02800.1 NrdH-like glutaredoxin [Mycobacterium phage Shaobing]QBP31651.1 NrdH-like glutaredoxin [Mycobacterium Phage Niklas]
MITIYTTGPQCSKCNLTKRAFDKAGVEYTEVRLDQAPETAEAMRADGHMVAPVVNDRQLNVTWSDFRRDMIQASIKARA